MLKLIRWCRFFEREYKPIMAVQSSIDQSFSDGTSSIGSGMMLDLRPLSINSSDGGSSSRNVPRLQGAKIRLNQRIVNGDPVVEAEFNLYKKTVRSVNFTLDRIQLNYTKKMQDSIYFQRWLLKGLILNNE